MFQMISFQKRHTSKPCHKSIVTDVVRLFFTSFSLFYSIHLKYLDFLTKIFISTFYQVTSKKKIYKYFYFNYINNIIILSYYFILLIHKMMFTIHLIKFTKFFFIFKKLKLIDLFLHICNKISFHFNFQLQNNLQFVSITPLSGGDIIENEHVVGLSRNVQ